MDRRRFLKTAAIGATVALEACASTSMTSSSSKLQRRPLGKTGRNLSVIGFGGIIVAGLSQDEANEQVRNAVERGVNYFDVAPSYGDAEERLGPALEPYRKDVFLTCKTTRRDAAGAKEEFERSLERLRTDHFDMYLLHAITTKEDVETAFGPDGAMQSFLKAREEGKVKYLGFSAHSPEAALGAMKKFDFDAFLYPINWVCDMQGSFSPSVIEKAEEKETGIIALKSMNHRPWKKNEERAPYGKCWYKPVDDPDLALLAIRYTLSTPATLAIPPGEAVLFSMAVDAAEKFTPLTDAERRDLAQRSEGVAPLFHA